MALEGSLRDFGLADILQLIYFQKKTGILTLSGRMDRVRLIFYEGDIVSAESRRRIEENRLGKILLKKGIIKEDELQAALKEQKATGARIGDILLKKGLVGKEDIRETLISQITETVVQIFSWKEGAYEFQPQPISVSKDMPITLNTQHLLMEGLRMIDEWSLIEGKLTLDTVFRKTEKTEALTPEEENVLGFVDGENDVSIIIELCGIDDFQASKTLVSLMEKGIIEPVEVSPVIVATAKKAETPFMKALPLAVFVIALLTALITTASHGWGLFNKLRSARDIDELRFMAEAYKYKNGSYPPDLSQIGKTKDVWGRPYVYRVEGDNLTILSAGPDGKVGTGDDIY
ncbi:MAG: hypothetical protein OHK0032_03380 [Thermodesulfovibrionales bacterium]